MSPLFSPRRGDFGRVDEESPAFDAENGSRRPPEGCHTHFFTDRFPSAPESPRRGPLRGQGVPTPRQPAPRQGHTHARKQKPRPDRHAGPGAAGGPGRATWRGAANRRNPGRGARDKGPAARAAEGRGRQTPTLTHITTQQAAQRPRPRRTAPIGTNGGGPAPRSPEGPPDAPGTDKRRCTLTDARQPVPQTIQNAAAMYQGE